MNSKNFFEYKEAVLEHCPRGEEYFCDGTPNLSVENMKNAENIGKCRYRQNGKCLVLERVFKEQVNVYDSKRVAGERI